MSRHLGSAGLLVGILAWGAFAVAQPRPGGQVSLEQRFQQLDRNGDGKLSRDEAGHLRVFDRLDGDGDGVVTLEEVALPGRGRGRQRTPERSQRSGPEWLSRPAVDLVLVVGDLERSLGFYRDGIGFRALFGPQGLADGTAVATLQWGQSRFYLRQPAEPLEAGPQVEVAGEDLKAQIVAANGLRLMYLLANDVPGVTERLRQLGYEAEAGTASGIGSYQLVADPDGNVVGLQEATRSGVTRAESLQIALTVSDEGQAHRFFGEVLGLLPAGQVPLRSMEATEYRYAAGQSIVKFWAPPGERMSFGGAPEERRGMRAIVFPVRDLAEVKRLLEASGARAFTEGEPGCLVVAGPDGVRIEFVEAETEPEGDAASDAAGEGQLFERADIPGVTDSAEPTQGMALVDLDQDGRTDIVLSRDRVTAFINEGGLQFREHPLQLATGISANQSPTFADFNGDGFLDFYLASVGGRNRAAFLLSQGTWDTFSDHAVAMGVDNAGAYARGQVAVGDVDGDGWLDMTIAANAIGSGGSRSGRPLSRLYVYRPAADGIYTHGRFEDIGGTDQAPGFGGVDPERPDPTSDVNGMCCVLRDLDDDGDLDLLRTAHNDMLRGDPLDRFATGECAYGVFAWRNQLRETGELRFAPVPPGPDSLAEHGQARWDGDLGYYVHESSAIAGETILTADTDNDGDLDVLVTGVTGPEVMVHSLWVSARFWENQGGFRFQECADRIGLDPLNWFVEQWHGFWGCPLPGEAGTAAAFQRGSTPKPKGERVPLADHQLYFGNSVLADLNNDGWLDLFQVTRFQGRADVIGAWRSNLFMNGGDGTFELVRTDASGIDSMGLTAHAADLDGDGLLDVYVMKRNKKREALAVDTLYRNTGSQFGAERNHWVRVRLTGLPQRQLLGAKLLAYDPISRRLLGRRDYVIDHMRGSHDATAHFGLGPREAVDLLVVLPDGNSSAFASLAIDREVVLDVQAGGTLGPDELPQQRLFERLDANGDGSITLDEARAGMGNR